MPKELPPTNLDKIISPTNPQNTERYTPLHDFLKLHTVQRYDSEPGNQDAIFTGSNVSEIDRPSTRQGVDNKDNFSEYEKNNSDFPAEYVTAKANAQQALMAMWQKQQDD